MRTVSRSEGWLALQPVLRYFSVYVGVPIRNATMRETFIFGFIVTFDRGESVLSDDENRTVIAQIETEISSCKQFCKICAQLENIF